MKLLHDLKKLGKIQPPEWLPDNCLFMGITGSYAYGVNEDSSDMDLYGFAIPPVNMIFPHLSGHIPGFGNQPETFEQFQKHHIDHNQKEYDITVFSLVKFFNLAIENNPNIIDVLFLPQHCILHSTPSSTKIFKNRHLFLHKGLFEKFVGYASSQNKKMKQGVNKSNPKRKKTIEKLGYDSKFLYHNVRLLTEAEQLLTTKEINFSKNADMLKSIRRGEWNLDMVDEYTNKQIAYLHDLKGKSDLPTAPNYDIVKKLLIEIIEDHYGTISKTVNMNENIIEDLETVIQKYKGK